MTPFDKFLPRLLPLVPGCPEPTAVMALLDAATEFCDRSRAVRVLTPAQPLMAGVAEYDADLPPGTEPVQWVAAWRDGAPLALPPAAARYIVGLHDGGGHLGAPVAAVPGEDRTLRVYPTPAQTDGSLVLLVAVRPLPTATAVPDELYVSWREPVVAGAAFRLMQMVGQPFTNLAQVDLEYRKFAAGVARAKVEANRDRTGAPLFVRPAPFL